MADTGHKAGKFEGHTPGPWTVWGLVNHGTDGGDAKGDNTDTLQITTADGKTLIADVPCTDISESAANAALIAAAPSLLARAEAAEERVRVLEGLLAKVADEDSYDRCNWIDEVEAALATTGVQHG